MVHWPLMDGLLHLVERGGAWASWGPAQSPPRDVTLNGVTLKLGRGRSRLLKMVPFDRSYTTFYWSAIERIGCGFLFAFHINYGRIFNSL